MQIGDEEGQIIWGDNLPVLQAMAPESVDFIYIDPPFNTGRDQKRQRMKVTRVEAEPDAGPGAGSEQSVRRGFGGRTYRSAVQSSPAYRDAFDDFLGFLEPRLVEAHRVLKPEGSFVLHIDYREAHYCKVLLDEIFGRPSFMNEIIWAYDFGGRPKSRWPAKHDTLFWYAKNPKRYTFNYDAMERIPYMAPGLVGPEKAARGKTPTDVWWHTIVSPTGKEKTGYPTQKPLGVLRRLIAVHTDPGDTVVDFFAGSGTTGHAAAEAGRRYVLIDEHTEAIKTIENRLAAYSPAIYQWGEAGLVPASSDTRRPQP